MLVAGGKKAADSICGRSFRTRALLPLFSQSAGKRGEAQNICSFMYMVFLVLGDCDLFYPEVAGVLQ